MLPMPRIMVVDDDKRHSDAIADALRRVGVECVPAHYDGENPESLHPALRGVRILLSDLHLIPGAQTANINQICQPIVELIEGGVAPQTPFVLVLWTAHPNELEDVRRHLMERLAEGHRPLAIYALDKNQHMAGADAVADAEGLLTALSQRLREMPAAAALLEWEEMLAKSARSAVDELHRMVLEVKGPLDYATALATLLARFAEHALGKTNAAERPAAGLSEVLVPIIADALSTSAGGASQEIWTPTLQAANDAAMANVSGRMNGRLHIGSTTDHGAEISTKEPGVVVELPEAFAGNQAFTDRFGLGLADAKKAVIRNVLNIEDLPCTRVLVRVEAPCDHAQGLKGPLLFAFGLVINASDKKSGSLPQAWWSSPPLQRADIAALANADKLLLVNTRMLFIAVGTEMNAPTILFRLRPTLAGLLSFHFGIRTIRPGIVQFP